MRTRIYFVYLQHGDKILEFVNTLNGLLQFLASQGPTRSPPAHSFLIKELERTIDLDSDILDWRTQMSESASLEFLVPASDPAKARAVRDRA